MTIDATDPVGPANDSLDVLRTCWTREAENPDRLSGATQQADTAYSDGNSVLFDATAEDQWREYDITTSHTIPGSNFGFQYRVESLPNNDAAHELTFSIDGVVFGTQSFLAGTSLGWQDPIDSDPGEIAAGSHTIRIERTDTVTADLAVDVIAPYDDRFNYTFDNTVHTTNGYLDGPELYPDVVPVQLTTTETRRDVTEANVTLDTNTTDANQYIELRIGSDAFDRTNNAASASTTGGPARSIDVTLGLTRYPDDSNPQSETPRYGYNGQSVDSYSLTANPDAINATGVGETEVDAIVGQGEITGDRIEEAAELTASDDALTRSILAPFDVFAETSVRSSERVAFNNDE